jgi:hypothetical protein|tara:strand:+ start:24 stop:1262 length:1239 start_codon:yes stop_codon:yes gene_type:complete
MKTILVLLISLFTFGDNVFSKEKLLPNTLLEIKVIKNWEPVNNFQKFKEYSKLTPVNGYLERENKKLKCFDRIKNVKPYPKDDNSHLAWFKCQNYLHVVGTLNPQLIGDILLFWASAKKDPMIAKKTTKAIGYNVSGYDIPSTLGTFAQFYAVWYKEINYTNQERELVNTYLVQKLFDQKFKVLNHGSRKCNIKKLKSIYSKNTGTNNCGNIRMKVAVGEIMLGFRLEDQGLLDKGHKDIYVVQAFINKDGININHASRGANTVNYSWEYTGYSSILVEVYRPVGYDYFEHTFPRGAKVKDYLKFNYRFLKDFKLTAKWAKRNVGSMSNPYKKISNLTQAEYLKTQYAENVYSFEHGDKEFIKAHPRFTKKYIPEVYSSVSEEEIKNFNKSREGLISANKGISSYALYYGNN